MNRLRVRSRVAFAVLLAACAPAARDSARPTAEFLLVSDDSTAWVRSSADTVIVQRAPMLLATLRGRLIEIYVADEPIHFSDMTFLVSRVFRRDLVSGDSTLVYADSTVLRDVIDYVRSHPGAERLESDEPADDASRAVEASITPSAVIGSTLGIEVHVDRTAGELGSHDTYRATVDLPTGRRLALGDVIGPAAAQTALVAARESLASAIVLAGRRAGPLGREASRAIFALSFDSLSFTLVRSGDSLAVHFLVHDEQVIDEARDTHRYSLEPLPLPSPAWWPTARRMLPRQLPDSSARVDAGPISLDVRYDSMEVAFVAARTSTGSRPVTRMRGPVRRVIVIGDSLVSPAGKWRGALERAFSESGYYSDQVRAASLRSRARPTAARQAAL